jgi:hypothetical protein
MNRQEIEHQLLTLSLSDKAEIVQSLTKTISMGILIAHEWQLGLMTFENFLNQLRIIHSFHKKNSSLTGSKISNLI